MLETKVVVGVPHVNSADVSADDVYGFSTVFKSASDASRLKEAVGNCADPPPLTPLSPSGQEGRAKACNTPPRDGLHVGLGGEGLRDAAESVGSLGSKVDNFNFDLSISFC